MNTLQEAQHIVHGPRANDYGSAKDNHATTAKLWVAFLSRRLSVQCNVTSEQAEKMLAPLIDAGCVAELNILQKMSRQSHLRKRDNMVDTAGYAANVQICLGDE